MRLCTLVNRNYSIMEPGMTPVTPILPSSDGEFEPNLCYIVGPYLKGQIHEQCPEAH